MACKCGSCQGEVVFDPTRLVCADGHAFVEVDYVYFTTADKGGAPRPPREPAIAGASLVAKLNDLWQAHVFSRALTPPGDQNVDIGRSFPSGPFYTCRGIGFAVKCTKLDTETWSSQRLGRAGDLVNQSFLVRLWTMLEDDFIGKASERRILPSAPGLPAVLLLKQLRNHYAHNLDSYTDEFAFLHREVVGDGVSLDGPYGFNLDINRLLQRLWADATVYVQTIATPRATELGIVAATPWGESGAFLAMRPGQSGYMKCSQDRAVTIGDIVDFADSSVVWEPFDQ